MRRVVVTGIGAITPLGVGIRRTWKKLLAGDCGVVSLLAKGQRGENDPRYAAIPCTVAATVPLGSKAEGGWDPKEWLDGSDSRRMAQFTQYAIAASQEALQDAGLTEMSDEDKMNTGVCIGSGIGSFEDVYDMSVTYDKGGYKKVSPLFVPRLLINMAAGHVTMKYGFRGPNHSVSTACTTGVHAIGDASRFIQFSDANIMLAGGSEACIHPLALSGFARAKSLSTTHNDTPHLSSRPFDRDRSGFVMGEGSGMLVLEELNHALSRNAKIYAEIKGYGLSSDAHHMTAPPDDGNGAFLAMTRCLKHAGIKPREVDYINAHATSTLLGDRAENRAIRALMVGGEHGRTHSKDVNISSSKGALGHLLGAAGVVEAIITLLAVKENILPPTLNLENPSDPLEEFDCNYVPQVAQDHVVNAALTNSFGFGGTNASLCFAKYEG
ncbi:ketoacyl synthase domain-containing protein [Peziza echinospora]|nr:ketoacyl synthase domain-containing protein [Peziza echinospora]KAI5796405.1 ketoacyl synthase domain-containing protein [Peziza echinospora]